MRKILRNCSMCDFSLMNTQFDTGASRHMFMRVTLVPCMRMLLEPAQTKNIGSYLVFYHNIIHKSLPAWTIRTLYSSYFPYLPRRISGFRWAQFLCFKIVYLFNTPTYSTSSARRNILTSRRQQCAHWLSLKVAGDTERGRSRGRGRDQYYPTMIIVQYRATFTLLAGRRLQ